MVRVHSGVLAAAAGTAGRAVAASPKATASPTTREKRMIFLSSVIAVGSADQVSRPRSALVFLELGIPAARASPAGGGSRADAAPGQAALHTLCWPGRYVIAHRDQHVEITRARRACCRRFGRHHTRGDTGRGCLAGLDVAGLRTGAELLQPGRVRDQRDQHGGQRTLTGVDPGRFRTTFEHSA